MDEQCIDFAVVDKQQQSQASAFVEEVEHTTEKLMKEVFGMANSSILEKRSKKEKRKQQKAAGAAKKKHCQSPYSDKRITTAQNDAFIKRSQYWQGVRRRNLEDLRRSKENLLQVECTYNPTTNSRKAKVEPLMQRYLDIQRSREKYIFQQRVSAKLKEELQFRQLTFQPNLNPHTSYASFEEFYQEEMKWEHHRNETIAKKKQLREALQHMECTFQPHIDTEDSPFYRLNMRKTAGTKVEDRLHQSLERTMDKRSVATALP